MVRVFKKKRIKKKLISKTKRFLDHLRSCNFPDKSRYVMEIEQELAALKKSRQPAEIRQHARNIAWYVCTAYLAEQWND